MDATPLAKFAVVNRSGILGKRNIGAEFAINWYNNPGTLQFNACTIHFLVPH